MSVDPDIKEKKKVQERIVIRYSLVLYNDDVNSFDHVINCLVRICNHELIQAEQCAWLVHNKGRCTVKSGPMKDLRQMCESLLKNGLTAQIE
ncbi:MAG: ATP-dependent Clp protease adaptor ClpS [Crocinitomicaceae bacterium]|jgi:ATP-dependent Clp protease adaptor protein ClpS|tara:strand:+ start:3602 stop:3877 length:276 start_codon:yes stop_codon:yes gene_type:complete